MKAASLLMVATWLHKDIIYQWQGGQIWEGGCVTLKNKDPEIHSIKSCQIPSIHNRYSIRKYRCWSIVNGRAKGKKGFISLNCQQCYNDCSRREAGRGRGNNEDISKKNKKPLFLIPSSKAMFWNVQGIPAWTCTDSSLWLLVGQNNELSLEIYLSDSWLPQVGGMEPIAQRQEGPQARGWGSLSQSRRKKKKKKEERKQLLEEKKFSLEP
jgi:hypothetical protein